MNRIIQTEELASGIFRLEIAARAISHKRKPGQFVMVMAGAEDERIPLTIADANPEKGTITLIVQAVGRATKKLTTMKSGEELHAVAGPLGHPTAIANYGTVLCLAGGIGIAPLYPIMKALKEAGNRLITVMGVRNKELLIMEKEAAAVSDELHFASDDGSLGLHGFVTTAAEKILKEQKIDKAVIVGPPLMMQNSVLLTKSFQVSSIVSLNPIMIDGTGMCGGCRVTVNGQTKFACVDGPEFEGDAVDFPGLIARLGMYKHHEHQCKLS